MKNETNKKISQWDMVKEMMGSHEILPGRILSYDFVHAPEDLLRIMSYYKFAAKMIGPGKKVLDIGCGEGLGTWLLVKECGCTKGIDSDNDSIKIAMKNWKDERISFECINFLDMKQEEFNAVVSVNIVKQVLPENLPQFFTYITKCLVHDGIVIIMALINQGVSEKDHANYYSWEQLDYEMKHYFHHVFMFCANDEVIQAGFLPMAHYVIFMGCRKY